MVAAVTQCVKNAMIKLSDWVCEEIVMVCYGIVYHTNKTSENMNIQNSLILTLVNIENPKGFAKTELLEKNKFTGVRIRKIEFDGKGARRKIW